MFIGWQTNITNPYNVMVTCRAMAKLRDSVEYGLKM
jgi:hypothetical protein